MKRHNLFLPEELVEKYRVYAQKRGIPMAEMIRIALEKYSQALEKAQQNG
jgi:predicted DNA binding CopG/RHH family protein